MKQKALILALMMTLSIGLKAQEKTINKSFDGIKAVKINTASGDCRISKRSSKIVEVTLV